MRHITQISIGLATMFLVIGILTSCTSSEGPKESGVSQQGGIAHAVHTDRLEVLMEKLGRSVQRDWPQEIEDIKADSRERRRQRKLEEAAQLAKLLAEAMAEMPAAIADADLSEVDREAFLDSASLLENQATNLSEAAAAGDADRVTHISNRIKTTCYGCHSQFRGEGGRLRFGD